MIWILAGLLLAVALAALWSLALPDEPRDETTLSLDDYRARADVNKRIASGELPLREAKERT